MKLYYSPNACSQAPHIIFHEVGMAHDAIRVDLKTKKLPDGSDYLRINPKGAVPALEFDNGAVLTENAVVLQYIATRAGDQLLFPTSEDFQHYRVMEWLNFIATELHKGFGPLFNRTASEEAKQLARDTVGKKLDFVEQELGEDRYLVGDRFTLPDAYLFVILGWTDMLNRPLSQWPRLASFREHISRRPAVRQVLEFEGLLEKAAAD
jgi:glutathione S-transferase